MELTTANWIIIISLSILACLCNTLMDEIRFHWNRTFILFFKVGNKLEIWFNPAKSWKNKYFPKNIYLRWLAGNLLVWMTDFWHFLKAIIINSVYVIMLIFMHTKEVWWKWLIMIFVLNIIWWIFFDLLFAGLIGAIGDGIRKRRKISK